MPQRPAPRAAGRHAAGNGDGGLPDSNHEPAVATAPREHRLRGEGKLRLVWVYPDLLSTYGDRGNLLVLSRRAELRGIEVEAIEVNSDEPVPSQGDIYLLGGGEDLPQILAANRLRQDGGLARAASRGAVVFAVVPAPDDRRFFRRGRGRASRRPRHHGYQQWPRRPAWRRRTGGRRRPTLSVPRLTGFENHQGVTRIGFAARPLARVSLGVGNGDGTEGAYAGKVLGTYLHGGPGAQSRPSRPAAQLGRRATAHARPGRRGMGGPPAG